jgi:hypothetical protein
VVVLASPSAQAAEEEEEAVAQEHSACQRLSAVLCPSQQDEQNHTIHL